MKLDHLERAKSKRKDAMDKIIGTMSQDDGRKFFFMSLFNFYDTVTEM